MQARPAFVYQRHPHVPFRRGPSRPDRRIAAMATGKAREVPEGLHDEALLLERLARLPNIAKATCAQLGPSVLVSVQLTQRDLPSNKQRKLHKAVLLPCGAASPGQQPAVLPSPLPDHKDASFTSTSPSGARTLVARAGPDGKGVLLEVWGTSGVLRELLVPAAQHGQLYSDGWFSRGGAWSPDEGRVVYIAERPADEVTPKWGAVDGGCADSAAPRGWRGQAAFEDDWGELNTGKRPPALFLLDVQAGTISQVEGMPAGSSVGQPVWDPKGEGIVFVAWPHEPPNFAGAGKKLGVVYCFNRPCALYYLPLPSSGQAAAAATAAQLTPAAGSAFMPVFTPDGARLVFLSQQAAVQSGVHCATSSLLTLPWPLAGSGEAVATTVAAVVQEPSSPDGFPGLYCTSLLERPFLGDAQLLLTSQWRSSVACLQVDLDSGSVVPITPLAPAATWSLLAVHGGRLAVASRSSPSCPPTLMLGWAPLDTGSNWEWRAVEDVTRADEAWDAVAEGLEGVSYEVLQVAPTTPGGTRQTFEAIVIRPSHASGPLPAVLTPHGGPHSAYSAAYYMPYLPLLAAGYCVVAVNYRGSLGYGEAALQSLPGAIGTHDTADCLAALDAAIAAGHVDTQRVAVIGGSHGGFLTGHLLGQHPARFRCGVLRNPVCNLSAMAAATDIPDWTFVEAFGVPEGRRRYNALPDPEVLQRLFEVSPAAHVDGVRAPMAFMLGAKDRRVPMQDALQYASALRARGVEVRVVVFPDDTHALDKPQTEFEQWINALWWLKLHVT